MFSASRGQEEQGRGLRTQPTASARPGWQCSPAWGVGGHPHPRTQQVREGGRGRPPGSVGLVTAGQSSFKCFEFPFCN